MSVPMYAAHKNYYFNVNQLSSANPFNTNPAAIYNPYQPPKPVVMPVSQPKQQSQTMKPQNANTFAGNSLYKNTTNKYVSNMNPTLL